MSNAWLRRLPAAVAASWLIALALLVSGCETGVREPRAKVTAAPAAPAAPPPVTGPAQLRVTDRAPANILVPGATLGVVQADGSAVPPPSATQPVRVALLLPLTGPIAPIGRSMQDAAQLALVDLGGGGIELMPLDTQGTTEGAIAAAQAALARNAALILGPLRGASTQAVAPIAAAADVPVISFSNDHRVAGGGVFVMGFVERASVDRAVSYTHQRGVRRFALLAPDSAYGGIVAEALRGSAETLGSQVAHIEFYDPATVDFAAPVQILSDLRAGGAGFEALMIAEGGERLRAIAAFLPGAGLDAANVRLLGTGLWDDAALGGEPGLIGAWYAVPPPSARLRFLAKYQENYGTPPHRLATLAYDATAMAAVLARSVGPAGYDPAVITQPNGFLGADGLFRFAPAGVVERGLAVMEVRPGGPVEVSPGLRTFQTLPAGAAGS